MQRGLNLISVTKFQLGHFPRILLPSVYLNTLVVSNVIHSVRPGRIAYFYCLFSPLDKSLGFIPSGQDGFHSYPEIHSSKQYSNINCWYGTFVTTRGIIVITHYPKCISLKYKFRYNSKIQTSSRQISFILSKFKYSTQIVFWRFFFRFTFIAIQYQSNRDSY